MKKDTLIGLFETTGTYINMTPTEKKIEKRKNQPRDKSKKK